MDDRFRNNGSAVPPLENLQIAMTYLEAALAVLGIALMFASTITKR